TIETVFDIDVWFGLCAIAQNDQSRRLVLEAQDEVIDHAVSWLWTDDVSEAIDQASKIAVVRKRGDERLACGLGRRIQRDGQNRAVILRRRHDRRLAIDRAAAGDDDLPHFGAAHGFAQ